MRNLAIINAVGPSVSAGIASCLAGRKIHQHRPKTRRQHRSGSFRSLLRGLGVEHKFGPWRRGRGLLVDLEVGAAASRSLGMSDSQLVPSALGVVRDAIPLAWAVRPTAVQYLEIVPGSASVDQPAHSASPDDSLRNALATATAINDVVIGCSASDMALVTNALIAADAYIVSVGTETMALDKLARAMEAVRHDRITKAHFLGILLTGTDNPQVARQTKLVRLRHGNNVLRAELPTPPCDEELADVYKDAVDEMNVRWAMATLRDIRSSFAH